MTTPVKERPLTPRQARFVAEYLIDLNASAAALRAGYSPKTAPSQGQRLLKNVEVAAAIQDGKDARAKRTEITQDRVIEETARLAFSNVTHYQVDASGNVSPAPGAPQNAMAAVASIKRTARFVKVGKKRRQVVDVEIKLWDKPGSLKLAGRHVALPGFFDKLEVTGANGGPLEVRSVKDLSSGERRKRIAELAAKRTAAGS